MSDIKTPRTDKIRDLIKCDALSDNFSTWYDHACQLERELALMTTRANHLEGGCHMAIGYIAGSTSDPEKSGTYRYLKSVTSADTQIVMPPATPETEKRGGDSCPAICSASRSNLCGDSSNAELPLFQGDDGGSHPTSPLQFLIRPISNETAENWVVKWHYSHRIPTGKNICFGLYASNELYAVIVYGIGVNPYQAKFLGVDRVLEIKRMCRREPPLPQYPLSRFIAITSKMAAKEYPYDCLIAFADPEQGHEGTVYRASGFVMHGMTNAEWHLEDENGTLTVTVKLSRKAETN